MPSLTREVRKNHPWKTSTTKKEPVKRWLTVDDSNVILRPKRAIKRN